jgi:hypothetical protein
MLPPVPLLRLSAFLALGADLLVRSAAATAIPPGAKTPYFGRVGLANHTIYLPGAEGYAYLRRARQGRVTWIRGGFSWSALEPAPNRFRWSFADGLMTNASKLGVNVLALATYAPDWALGRTDDKFVARSFIFDWTRPTPGDGYNLIRPDGSATLAWIAIKRLIVLGQ